MCTLVSWLLLYQGIHGMLAGGAGGGGGGGFCGTPCGFSGTPWVLLGDPDWRGSFHECVTVDTSELF